jgi:hypothetical protein
MFVIEPYVSAGPFEFGMIYDDVRAALGAPSLEEKSLLGDVILRYDGFGATIAKAGVVEVYSAYGESNYLKCGRIWRRQCFTKTSRA